MPTTACQANFGTRVKETYQMDIANQIS